MKGTAAARAVALGLLASTVPAPPPGKRGAARTVGQHAARAKARPARPADPDGAPAWHASFVAEDPLARPHVALLRALAAAGPRTPSTRRSCCPRWPGTPRGSPQPGVEVTADSVMTRTWCNGGSCACERMRADVTAVAVPGLGAGLSAAEIVATEGSDVREQHGIVLVTVHEPRDRTVPVRARYAPVLLALADLAGSTPLFRPRAGQGREERDHEPRRWGRAA